MGLYITIKAPPPFGEKICFWNFFPCIKQKKVPKFCFFFFCGGFKDVSGCFQQVCWARWRCWVSEVFWNLEFFEGFPTTFDSNPATWWFHAGWYQNQLKKLLWSLKSHQNKHMDFFQWHHRRFSQERHPVPLKTSIFQLEMAANEFGGLPFNSGELSQKIIIIPKYADPSNLASFWGFYLRKTGSFTLPLEGPSWSSGITILRQGAFKSNLHGIHRYKQWPLCRTQSYFM